jgi:hypothetical protein
LGHGPLRPGQCDYLLDSHQIFLGGVRRVEIISRSLFREPATPLGLSLHIVTQGGSYGNGKRKGEVSEGKGQGGQ